jgi:hypothetical protein
MSIPVALPDLPATLDEYPWGYFMTVTDDLRAHALAVPTVWRDGALQLDGGNGTRAAAVSRPNVTMVFPSPSPGEYSLIVDGTATVHEDGIMFTPTWAVLHRPAIS